VVEGLFEEFIANVSKSAQPYQDLPPAGFDPLTASDRLLETYGLPTRPDSETEPELFEFWKLELGNNPTFIVPVFPRDASYETRFLELHRALAQPQGQRVSPIPHGFAHREKSQNWSGAYITPKRPFRFFYVTGSWIVPEPSIPAVMPGGNITGTDEYRSSTWVGLDGHRTYPNSSLPQIGTSQHVKIVNGQPVIQTAAWYQWWVKDIPAQGFPVEILNFPVTVGDHILASLTVLATGDVLFNIKNQNTGILARFLVIAPPYIVPLGSTAEWIHERPTEVGSRRMYPMPRCTDVQFRHCLARSAAAYAMPATLQKLDTNARMIRMYETFDAPHRTAAVSFAKKTSKTSVLITYNEPGP
jgi:Peptidase A4 family